MLGPAAWLGSCGSTIGPLLAIVVVPLHDSIHVVTGLPDHLDRWSVHTMCLRCLVGVFDGASARLYVCVDVVEVDDKVLLH